jgi:undecaprenyl-diphosphatase
MTHAGGFSHARSVARRPSGDGSGQAATRALPALEPRPGGAAERLAAALRFSHPVLVFVAIVAVGIALLAGLSMLLGLLVWHVLATGAVLGGPDGDVVRTLAHHRTGTLTDFSSVGTAIGGAPVLPILVGVIAIGALIARRPRLAAFAVFVLAAESAVYRLTTFVIHRPRPAVQRLEDLPVNASYPSGHTAASIAVYCGLALLLTSSLARGARRVGLWVLALLLVAFVIASRMYRGMHHPLDVAGGALVGMAAICLLLLACRAAGAAAAHRRARA